MITFIHPPKTAGCTIRDMLKDKNRLDPKSYNNHSTRLDLPDRQIYVATIRNPYDRVYSLYSWWKFKAKRINHSTFEDFVLDLPSLLEQNKEFQSCFDFIKDENGNPIENIIRFESLEEDYLKICKKYNIDFPKNGIIHLNSNSQKHPPDKSKLYTPLMQQIVEEIYHKDLFFFNYNFQDFKNAVSS